MTYHLHTLAENGSRLIGLTLDQCPNLSSLSLIGFELGLPGDYIRRMRPTFLESGSKSRPSSGSLQSLSIMNHRVSPGKLQDLIPKLKELTSISLIDLYLMAPDPFQNQAASQGFWETLARHYLFLRSISFSLWPGGPEDYRLPVELFPLVANFGINYRRVTSDNPNRRALSGLSWMDNRLTALEIAGGGTVQNEVLRQFLCSSPQILHLKFPGARIS